MSQSKKHSAMESVANIVAGTLIALATQEVVFPWVGLAVNTEQNLKIVAIFTVVSLVRSYTLRRIFNRLRSKT